MTDQSPTEIGYPPGTTPHDLCGVAPAALTDQQRSASGAQREFDYNAMTAIAAHLQDNPAHPFSGRQCAEFVLNARDRLYSGDSVLCEWCGEVVAGPCAHPGDPCGLYGAPDQSADKVGDAAQVEREGSRDE